MRACVECSPNQPKRVYLIDLSTEQLKKLLEGFWNSAGCVCISILPEDCNSALNCYHYCMCTDRHLFL